MKARLSLAVLALALPLSLLLPSAAAHPVPYVAGVLVEVDVGLAGATITIVDALPHPVSGRWCQDLDSDSLCGEVGEPNHRFCESAVVGPPLWDPTARVFVRVDTPLDMFPLTPCGAPSWGTTGHIDHS